ncbi:hypothetical protein ACIA8O_14965 [Kitasatospora sp. NPDC051853]|uniref:hypothetical protein n=1 Tax=Kitasatospora sp. NPDC051853 TaxID=3364058 RepID=UPI00378DF5FB
MRTLIKVEYVDNEAINQRIADGTLTKTLQGIMSHLKPEAAYFCPTGGHRCAYLFVDLPDEASLVPFIEPFWELQAEVTVTPCMNAEDLATGLGRISDSG